MREIDQISNDNGPIKLLYFHASCDIIEILTDHGGNRSNVKPEGVHVSEGEGDMAPEGFTFDLFPPQSVNISIISHDAWK